MERRLTAIFTADMVGYSRLIEADETGTLARQKRHRLEVIGPKIAAHKGRIVKLTGDGIIAEFPSVVEAVQCAVAIQREMAAREADQAEDRRIRYRAAINLGDVIFDEGDVYGDGVNIAARLETLAEPGGIVVSGTAYDHLKSNVEVGYEDLGEHTVKNITTPVRVYRVVPNGVGTVARRNNQRRWLVVASSLAVIGLLATGSWWWAARPEFTPADPAKMEYALNEPSIAVLAFDNLTGDPAQEHVSDGISADIISSLTRLPEVVVIARSSTFSYKGMPVDVRTIAEELSVRYVLEGSLQSFGDQVRVTAQLIDAVSGHNIWSRNFDGPRAEFFNIRDEITYDIIVELNSELVHGEAWGSRREHFRTVENWLLARKSIWHAFRFNREDNLIAIDMLHEILRREPNSARAHAMLAYRHSWVGRAGWSDDPQVAFERAAQHAEQAIALGPDAYFAYSALAFTRFSEGRFEEAISSGERALKLAPSDAEQMALLGIYLQRNGEPGRSVTLFEQAARLDGKAPGWFWGSYADSLRISGRYEDAIPKYRMALKQGAAGIIAAEAHLGLAVCLDALGRTDEARTEVTAAVKAHPETSLSFMDKAFPYKDQDYKDRWLATLTRLGLPE